MPKSSPSPKDVKPYIKPDSSPPRSKESKDRSTKTGVSKAWTSSELVQLFEHVSKFGTQAGNKGWELAVQGRTANQARQAWLTTAPFLKKALEERGKKGEK